MRKVAVTLFLLAAPVALSAPPSPEQVNKYRHTVMKAAGSHIYALGMVVKGESDRNQDAAMHANALRDLAKTIGALFPEGTGPEAGIDTEAKAEIWSKKDEWAAAVKLFEDETAKLAEVAAGGDMAALKAQYGKVGGACGDCHDVFREEDEDH